MLPTACTHRLLGLLAGSDGTLDCECLHARHDRATTPPLCAALEVEDNAKCFIARDHDGQALSYVDHEIEAGRRTAANLLTRDEARRVAMYVAKLPDLLGAERRAEGNPLAQRRRSRWPSRQQPWRASVTYRSASSAATNPRRLRP